MSSTNKGLQQSALVMKILGWGTLLSGVSVRFSIRLGSFGGVPGTPYLTRAGLPMRAANGGSSAVRLRAGGR